MHTLITGPILGVEGETQYSVCFVSKPGVTKAKVQFGTNHVQAAALATLHNGLFWRADLLIPAQAGNNTVQYSIELDGAVAQSHLAENTWSFVVPAGPEDVRMAYGSCNGFSDLKLMNSTQNHYALWERLWEQHKASPFSLLMLGGDQIYADSIWTALSSIKAWNCLSFDEKVKRKANKTMLDQLDRFYSQLYCERWLAAPMARALASIPSVMMWDDHDIIDGWGSYPDPLQNCEVYKAIFAAARKYFELFQLRGATMNKSRLADSPEQHCSLGFSWHGFHVLALDNRSERSLDQIMSGLHWDDIATFLGNVTHGDLLLLAAVPVVYRDFSFAEKTLDSTPWEEEITDDLKDHWRAKEHQGERAKLIMRLLENARKRQGKTVILSGDVHVGCLGVIKDTTSTPLLNVHQVVSSGIVHPAPSALQWAGVLATTNDRTETLDENGQIQIDMLRAFGAGKYFRTRNYITLKLGTDNKLWVNWECENGEKPVYPLA